MTEVDLSQVDEALVVHPGDVLVVRVGSVSAELAKELKDRLEHELTGVRVLIIAGAKQILAYRPDDDA